MTLSTLYSWFLNGGAALLGPALYMLLEQYAQLDTIPQKYRRPLVALLSVLLGGLFWILGVCLGFIPHPTTLQDWANGIWQASISAGAPLFLTSQITHSFLATPSAPTIMTLVSDGSAHPALGKPIANIAFTGAHNGEEAHATTELAPALKELAKKGPPLTDVTGVALTPSPEEEELK